MARKSHEETRVLPYTCAQMFTIVSDAERYPEFVPWVKEIQIVERTYLHFQARMRVSFLGFEETLLSNVFLDRGQKWIRIHDTSNVVKSMHSNWTFQPLARGRQCQITFRTTFELRSAVLQLVAGQFFSYSSSRIVTAFEQRAQTILNPA